VHQLLRAVKPVVDALGATVVPPGRMREGDIELEWDGEVVGGVRLPDRPRDIEWFLSSVERTYDRPLADLDRVEKQRVVKALNEAGAFGLRKSVEQVAEVLGVSRFTVYNYLNRPEE
jgi:hypothetical protein